LSTKIVIYSIMMLVWIVTIEHGLKQTFGIFCYNLDIFNAYID